MFKVLQVNLNRSREAHDLMEHTVAEEQTSLCLVTEPNRAVVGNSTRWRRDTAVDAAILCATQGSGPALARRQGAGEGFVWVEVEGVVIYSCYFSPNRSLDDFITFLDDVGRSLRSTNSADIVITGDFNAAAAEWGSSRTCRRGAALLEWIIGNDLVVVNDGRIPTFHRRGQESYIDLTLCTERTLDRIERWKVHEERESLSDHRYISFQIRERGPPGRPPLRPTGGGRKYWTARKLDWPVLRREVDDACRSWEDTPGANESTLADILVRACEKAGEPRGRHSGRHRPKYWWTEEIREARDECNRTRRVCTRSRGRTTEAQHNDYREARKELRKLIKRSKAARWKEICEEVQQDPWGKGYKIAMKKLGAPLPRLPADLLGTVVRKLFPRQEPPTYADAEMPEDYPPVTLSEIIVAGARLKAGKAGGPDGVPPEVVKYLLKEHPTVFQRLVDGLLREGRFPNIWKEARLTLIPKPGKEPGSASAYRPLCLLSTAGKALEAVICGRLVGELEEKGCLSDDQYGFRKGRSTLSALRRVLDRAEEEARKTLKTRGFCLVILLDVRNAFNTMNWGVIARCMEEKGISNHLRRMIASYLSTRAILMGEDGARYEVTAGVPQGSILGPTLWNLAYNGVLELALPDGVETVAYADDLALIVTAREEAVLEARANEALDRVAGWMEDHLLELAPEKTEAVLLIGRKRCRDLQLELRGHRIKPQREVKYLGVMLDRGLTGSAHVSYVTKKVAKATAGLARLMPRVDGAQEDKRRLLATVADSIVLYGAPVWEKAMKTARNRRRLRSAQRPLALRICRAYRTVSTEAALVLARLIPWDLAVRERAKRWRSARDAPAGRPAANDVPTEDSSREETLDALQQEWTEGRGGGGDWTRRLIKDVRRWYGRTHGEVTYHLTQVLTGHGCFQQYLCRIGKAASATCVLCDTGEDDSVTHTLERCPRFEDDRSALEEDLQQPLRVEDLVDRMLEGEEEWTAIASYIETVMREKEAEERARERRRRHPSPAGTATTSSLAIIQEGESREVAGQVPAQEGILHRP